MIERIRVKYVNLFRRIYLKRLKLKLKNKEVSLISSNCTGATMLHDLGLRFNSPFVNLWIGPKEYIRLLSDLESYMNMELEFIYEEGISYPIGLLGDVRIYFQHYGSEEEARNKWDERKKRINYNNLFILFSDRDGCSKDDLIEFDKLPYKNKIVFTNREYLDIKSAFYIRGFEKEQSVGMCMAFTSSWSYKKYFDQFDAVSWFNHNHI